jgi:hypothetical protein
MWLKTFELPIWQLIFMHEFFVNPMNILSVAGFVSALGMYGREMCTLSALA